MNILAIDTGGDCCAVTLRIDGKLASENIIQTQRDQAKILAPLTQELLKENNLNVNDIDRFGIAIGPGSFTGLRVGLAFIRGLALGSGKQAYGFDHFKVIARALNQQPAPVLIIRESKREDLFCAWLKNGKLSDYFLSTAQNLVNSLPSDVSYAITGNGAAALVQLKAELKANMVDLSDSDFMKNLCELVEQETGNADMPPQPLYLRDADVNIPKHIV
ncbi:MAG: tRNA (adenosine(37)-N6)-threonylcarbamoyltransferase complex dimerization subunit type 1 TsaB [Alphaproteobacteria bacterium]|nr:tRNA (adenosine(37)-N6)-threonylcarbamoyltransferase complex dimerization subunit type 1 TsaB [Alphaproteobacteria bacterium]